MRKVIAWAMVLLGTFLLVVGLLVQFWGVDALKKTPLGVTSVTDLAGTVEKLNPGTGEVETFDVKVTNVTKSDDEKSDDEVVAFVTTTCVVIDIDNPPDCVDADDPQERLVTATVDVFAADRVTAEAVNDPKYLPADAIPHEGLVNKWPFDAQRRDYQYWDSVLRRGLPAVYSGTEDIEGIETYTYVVTADEEPAEIVQGVDGLYTVEKRISVDPRTGSIIRQENRDIRTLENGDPVVDLHVTFTDEEIQETAKESDDGASQLRLLSVFAPLIGIVLGLVLLVGGAFVLARASRRPTEQEVPQDVYEDVY